MLREYQTNYEYQSFLRIWEARLDSSQRLQIKGILKPAYEKLKLLNLDPMMNILSVRYSEYGRPAVNQPQIFRSFILLFLLSNIGIVPLSLDRWVEIIKGDELYCILIGCHPGSSPPLGSYYDFMNRFWTAPLSDWYTRNKTFASSKNKSKPKSPAGKGQKASERHPKITERIASRIMDNKEHHCNFERFLQKVFFSVAVYPSIKCGVIPQNDITLCGDGTAVHTHANPHGKTIAHADDGSPLRHFSDPDASFGWDSDIDNYYFGYTLYHLSVHNPDLKVDLPLILRFTSAKRHDSVNFLITFKEFPDHSYGLTVRDVCLDAAHDNYPTYRLLNHLGIRPFIDLNSKCGRPKTLPPELVIDKDGTPVCPAGHRMICHGYCTDRSRVKWRCPYVMGKVKSCDCICSPSAYGRVIYTKPEWDIRLYPPVPRGTPAFKEIYKQRTSTERVNNRILNDYKLHSMVIHTTKRYSFVTMIIGICLHLDARYKQIKLKSA